MEKKVKSKKRKRKKRIRRIILIVVLVLVVALAGGFGLGYAYLNNLSKKSNQKEKVNLTKVNEDGIVNVLVMGTDAGTYGTNSASDPKRTDTIMLLHYNPKTKKATLVSIPRDTMVQLKGKNDKINAAHFYGGVNMAVDTVQKLLGIKINYYVKIDLNGFVKLIDILGGVEMPIEHRMDYDDNTQNLHIHFTKGQTVLLNGQKAMEFFRWRENNDGTGLANGDLDRINIQHAFIQKVVDKVKSPTIITKIPSILSAIPENVDTNMTAQDIMQYGYIFAKMDSGNLNITTLKGKGQYIGKVSYFVWDKSQDTDLLSTLRETSDSSDSSSSGSSTGSSNSSSNTNTSSGADRSSLRVEVLNGTGRSGLAAAYAKDLKQLGYTNVVAGNAKKTTKSKVTAYGLSKGNFSDIKSDFTFSNIENIASKDSKYDIVVVLGSDYSK